MSSIGHYFLSNKFWLLLESFVHYNSCSSNLMFRNSQELDRAMKLDRAILIKELDRDFVLTVVKPSIKIFENSSKISIKGFNDLNQAISSIECLN